jgi:hypothetical protein
MILSTDVATASTGNGSFLKVEHEVASGPYQGRKVFDQITLENVNPQATEIGQRQLSALCHACGWLDPLTDSDVLHGRTLRAKVGIDPERTDQKTGKTYGARNKIVAYILPGQNGAAKPAPAPAKAAAPPAAAADIFHLSPASPGQNKYRGAD